MAYTINKTDGTILATITDGTIDNSTSLTLFGKSYSGFGELLNENLVKLLENSSSTSAPTAPLKGELWFDSTTAQLKVYDGSIFKPTGGAKSASTAPSSPGAGDLWMDSDDDQVYVYTGSAWLLVGPTYTSGQTLSGWKIETLGSAGGNKVVSSMYAGNTRVCILSKETFTPSVSQTGFASIKAGLTLNSTLGAVFEGTNTQATYVDISSTTNSSSSLIAGGNFIRADDTNGDTMVGRLIIDSDNGLQVGGSQELTISVSSGDVTFANSSSDKDMIFTVNDDGSTAPIMTLDASDEAVIFRGNMTIHGTLSVTGEYDAKNVAINTYDDAFIKLNNGNSETDSGLIVETGDTDDARMFYEVGTNRWMAGEGANYSQVIRASDATTNGATSPSTVLTTDSSGGLTLASLSLSAVGSISEGDTSNKAVPTIGAVVTWGDKWAGAEYTVSTSAPTSGDGANGDFWFQRES